MEISNPPDIFEAGVLALIAAHKADAVAHQNAPGLIATHAGIPNVHHVPTGIIATGTYAGNATADRQITVGFKCSMVIIAITIKQWILVGIHSTIHKAVSTYHGNTTSPLYLHASDGFVVGETEDTANGNGVTFYYWAISE